MAARRTVTARRVTMAEIAAAAGVSVPTVSKVLNGRADVAPETRSRVESLLEQYKYVRSASRRLPHVGLIDLVFTDLNPWAVEIIRGAEEAALAAQTRIIVSALQGDEEWDRWLDILATRRSDGVILVLSDLPQSRRQRLSALGLPVVIVDPVGQPDPHIPSIGATNWAGGMTATQHLIELGHRRIGTITGKPSLLCSQARLGGYRAAMERAGLAVDPALVRPGDFHHASALTAALEMLDSADPPTAIFAASDEQALGVYEAVRQRHLRVPDDVSVVGFDDLPMSGWTSPPLTTIRQPLAQMATLGMRTLLSSLDGSTDHVNNRVELSTELIVRSSTAPPRDRAEA